MPARQGSFWLTEVRGLTSQTDSESPPASNTILGYEAYQYGPKRASWQPGFIQKALPGNITRYITNGAGVSAPSESLGFYFSGMRAMDWGLIQAGNLSNLSATTANTLVSINMSVMRQETWANDTLPEDILGRANAELVWIPVSRSGVLIAIGGVINPASLTATQALTQAQAAASVRLHPLFFYGRRSISHHIHRIIPTLLLWKPSLSMILQTSDGKDSIPYIVKLY
jgi:hypothetical protein